MDKKIGIKSSAQDNFLEPKVVTGVTASDVGTSRAYDNGAITVSWTAYSEEPAPTNYKVIEGSTIVATVAVGTNSATITGLATGSSHTYKVVAYNGVGDAPDSTTASATVTTVPATPAAPTATAGVNQDTVSWVAPATGGKAISGYTWASSDGKGNSTASTSVVVAQEANTAQTYTVYATNANGNSGTSAASNNVTTQAPSFFSPPFFPPFFPPGFFSPPFFPPFFPPGFFSPPFFPPFFPPNFFAPPFFPPFFPPNFFAPPFFPPFFPPNFFSPPFFPPYFGIYPVPGHAVISEIIEEELNNEAGL